MEKARVLTLVDATEYDKFLKFKQMRPSRKWNIHDRAMGNLDESMKWAIENLPADQAVKQYNQDLRRYNIYNNQLKNKLIKAPSSKTPVHVEPTDATEVEPERKVSYKRTQTYVTPRRTVGTTTADLDTGESQYPLTSRESDVSKVLSNEFSTPTHNQSEDDEEEMEAVAYGKTPRIVGALPKTLRGHGQDIIKTLKQSERVDWTPKGELVFDGKIIPGTNKHELIHDITRNRKNTYAYGREQFAKVVKAVNVPEKYIKNKAYFKSSIPRRKVRTPKALNKRGNVKNYEEEIGEESQDDSEFDDADEGEAEAEENIDTSRHHHKSSLQEWVNLQ